MRNRAIHHLRRMIARVANACFRLKARFLPVRLPVFSRAGGLGDELMVLGVLQSFAVRHPKSKIIFYSRYTELFQEAPGSMTIVPHAAGRQPMDSLELTYAPRTMVSINEQLAAMLGIKVEQYPIHLPRRPNSELVSSFPREGSVLVIQSVASGWTPNKQWPEHFWREFVESLPADIAVVEAGQETVFQTPPQHPRFLSLVGKTTLKEYVAVVQHATVFVGPPSSGMHLAHAFDVPSVIVIGGYEAPVYPYPLATQIYTDEACAPCWLRTPCPYQKKCLTTITPERVRDAVLVSLQRGPALI